MLLPQSSSIIVIHYPLTTGWALFFPLFRFFNSLVDDRRDDAPESGPALRKSFLESVVKKERVEENKVQKKGVVIDLSWESLLEFQNQHLTHTAHTGVPDIPRKRPNYDDRKRKFMASMIERRRFLAPCLISEPFCCFCACLCHNIWGQTFGETRMRAEAGCEWPIS